MKQPPVIQLIASQHTDSISGGTGISRRTCLWAISGASGRNYYFISVHSKSGSHEDVETSPVIGNSRSEALRVFNKIHALEGGVAPCHLTDVVRDMIWENAWQRRHDATDKLSAI